MPTFWIAGAAAALQLAQPAPALDWRVAPVVPGAWSYRPLPGGSEAIFQDYRGPQLIIRCTLSTRQVSVIRVGAQPGVVLGILTTSAQMSLPAGGSLSATHSLWDALAFSRGRFAVQSGAAAPLIVPAWPDAARSIEDCRK